METPSKLEVMLALLERAEASVHLDARRPGVSLPPQLLGRGQLRLDYSYGFSPPIRDLVIDDKGIAATLSFSGQPSATFVPWSAVYLIVDFSGHGAVWNEDIPSDLKLADPPSPPPEQAAPAKKKRPSHLKLVD